MTFEHLPHDYSDEPRLPRPAPHDLELAAPGCAGTHPFVPGKFCQDHAARYLPLLPFLLALWVPGGLQVWCAEGWRNGCLARCCAATRSIPGVMTPFIRRNQTS